MNKNSELIRVDSSFRGQKDHFAVDFRYNGAGECHVRFSLCSRDQRFLTGSHREDIFEENKLYLVYSRNGRIL